jgi:hypothetical protein
MIRVFLLDATDDEGLGAFVDFGDQIAFLSLFDFDGADASDVLKEKLSRFTGGGNGGGKHFGFGPVRKGSDI